MPPCRHQRMWCGWQRSKGTWQPGIAQVGCITRNARRCARVANRRVRPTSSTTPSRTVTGVTTPSHSIRRIGATGSSTSCWWRTTESGCRPWSTVSASITTITSLTPGCPCFASVNATNASADRCAWRSCGSVGQVSGARSWNSSSAFDRIRFKNRVPVSGSSWPVKRTIPDPPSTHDRNPTSRRCCSRRPTPSSPQQRTHPLADHPPELLRRRRPRHHPQRRVVEQPRPLPRRQRPCRVAEHVELLDRQLTRLRTPPAPAPRRPASPPAPRPRPRHAPSDASRPR